MVTRSCGIGRDIRPSPMPFAYKLPSWYLVVMTTAHSSQNSFGRETEKKKQQVRRVIDKISFIMKMLLTLTLRTHVKSNHNTEPAGNEKIFYYKY